MVLTAEDIAAISHIVAATLAQMPNVGGTATNQNKRNRIDEKHYRRIQQFSGSNWKDFAFQFKAATRSSSEAAYEVLCWAESEATEVDPEMYQQLEAEDSMKISGELFNTLTTTLNGEPLQMLHNCGYNGLEAWRRLSKRYSPTTPLRAMQLMLQVISPEKTKDLKNVQAHIDRWEAKVLMLTRDFKETVSDRMKAAILISTLPNELRDAILQQPEKFESYEPTKERVISMIEAKLAIRSPDEMDVDHVTETYDDGEYDEEVQAVGKGGIYCYRCGGQGHIAAKCATPEPQKGGKGKGGPKGGDKDGKGKGKSKGKGKGEWVGFCNYCGKRGHGPKDCWNKQRDEANGDAGNKGGGLASVEDNTHHHHDDHVGDVNGFDIATLEAEEWTTAGPRKGRFVKSTGHARLPQSPDHIDINMVDKKGAGGTKKGRITIDSGAAESVIPPSMLEEVPIQESAGSRAGLCYIAANGGKMPNLGEKHVKFRTKEGLSSSVMFQVTHTRKPFASVSKIVRKGNKVVFAPDRSYIENVKTGNQIELIEEFGTYHLDVDFLTEGFPRQVRNQRPEGGKPKP